MLRALSCFVVVTALAVTAQAQDAPPAEAPTPTPAVVPTPEDPPEPPPAVPTTTAPITPPATPVVAAPSGVVRLYVAPFVGATSDPATLTLVEDRVLVAARSLPRSYEVIGASDVRGILDIEASKIAIGCDTTSCANEIADALNADELITGQLGHIGQTWQLTITRTERKNLRVVGRSVRDARGDTPEGLLEQIPEQVAEVFGLVEPPPNVMAIAGVSATVVGAAAVVVGGAVYGFSWSEYFAALADLDAKDGPPASAAIASATEHRASGEAALPIAFIVGGAGLVVVIAGAALWALAPADEPATFGEAP